MTVIAGTPNDDVINGTQGDDTITGDDGNDVIVDRWGDDTIEGGDGDDEIIDEGGNNTILGGAGDDRITISDRYSQGGSTIGYFERTNFIDAGTGNDFVTIGRMPGGSLSIDLGDGDDVLEFTSTPIGDVDYAITLGAGRDQVLLRYDYGDALRTFVESVITISDFTAGSNGDVLNIGDAIRGYFNNPTEFAAFDGFNPFTNGVLVLTQDGADTLVQIDYDGSKSDAIQPRTILRLENVSASSLTAENFAGFDPSGAVPSVISITGTAEDDLLIAPSAGADISGGTGDDEIIGSFRSDILNGDDGNDVIVGGSGHDIIRGGEGDDLITDEWGNDTIEGGAGNDRIEIYRPGISTFEEALHETVTINAGDGNDLVRFELGRNRQSRDDVRTATLIADLGDGDDVIEILGERFRSLPDATITLGAGRDHVHLGTFNSNSAEVVITDFAAGAAGDVLHITDTLSAGQGWDLVTNPFATGHLRVEQSGADTLVIFDYDGTGGGSVRL